MKRLSIVLLLLLLVGNAWAGMPPDGTGGWTDDGTTTSTDRAVVIGTSGAISEDGTDMLFKDGSNPLGITLSDLLAGAGGLVAGDIDTIAELNAILTDFNILDWSADQGATNLHINNIPDLSAVYLTPAAAAAAYQPLDADLAALAALTTDAYGLALLELTGQAGLLAVLDLEATDSPTYAGMTLNGAGGLTLGAAGSVQGTARWYSNTPGNLYHFDFYGANFTENFGWRVPTGYPAGNNYLLNVDTDGTMGYTDPSTLGGDDLGSAAAADVVALFNSGTCSGYLKSDGTCDTPSGAAHDAVTIAAGIGGLTLTDQVLSLHATLEALVDNSALSPTWSNINPTFGTVTASFFQSSAADGSRMSTLPNNTVGNEPTIIGTETGFYSYQTVMYLYENGSKVGAVLTDADISTSAELAGLLSDETGYGGSGVVVFNNEPSIQNPTVVGNLYLEALGSGGYLAGGNGTVTIGGEGDGQDESLTFDFNSTANAVLITSPVDAVDLINFGTIRAQLPTLELGHASDSTLARSAAGVLTIEGRYLPSSAQAQRIYVSDACSGEAGMSTGDLCFEY